MDPTPENSVLPGNRPSQRDIGSAGLVTHSHTGRGRGVNHKYLCEETIVNLPQIFFGAEQRHENQKEREHRLDAANWCSTHR